MSGARERRAEQHAKAEGEACRQQRATLRVKCNEALRPLQLRAADACGNRGPIPTQARSISSHDIGSVLKALKPPVGSSITAFPLEIKIGAR